MVPFDRSHTTYYQSATVMVWQYSHWNIALPFGMDKLYGVPAQ